MAARHPTTRRGPGLDAACLVWLSETGLGDAEVLAVASNDWLAQQTPAALAEYHRNLEERQQRQQRQLGGRGDDPAGP